MRKGRRNFLKGLGAATALASPFASILQNATRADGEHTAQRLIVFFSPNGSILRHWRPSGGESDFSFPAGSILEPLSAWKEKLLVIDGLDFKAHTNHEGGMAAMLTGGGGASTMTRGQSLDQYVASQIGEGFRFPSVSLGVQTSAWGASNQTRMGYYADGTFVSPDDRPADVFRRMFGDVAGGGEADIALMRRQGVLDLVRHELSSLQRQLGAEERLKLDAHLESIRQLETSLMVDTSACSPPRLPPALDSQANDSFPAVLRAQTDLLVASLACDMTRVASLQCSHTVSPTVPSWLGISEGHHALSHMSDGNAAGVRQFVEAERWFAEQFAYLLERLDTTADVMNPGKSLLDTTAVLWAKEMGDARLHSCDSVPFVVAGAPNHFNLGRYLRFPGVNHQKLLVSMCHAVGLSNPTFGDPSFGTGPLSGLTL